MSVPQDPMPPPSRPALPAVDPPKQIERASLILYLTAGLQLLALAWGLSRIDVLEARFRELQPGASQDEIDAAVSINRLVSVVVALAIAAVFVLCARKLREGRGWARNTATALQAITVMLGLFALASVRGADLVIQLVSVGLGIAFLVLAWSAPSSAYVATMRAPRARPGG